ncbi:MAG: ABC transporter ATP-binding protein [Jaaginema sp. PMC 1080.18]|nr:ABC transporter ATP-binding protein [Jaaginema sp. PMC 1080.18]MEC4864654.1 ABC transporter ATP-binding protein [Jaaginema sp. PMC 1078.18]
MHAVELKEISKVYKGQNNRDFLAVDNVNLQIAEGEFFSLLGPSGCGKTTLLRSIAGFDVPTSGEILIHGQPMRDRPPFERPVNTVFQNYALFPHLTVAENVAFGLEMDKVPTSEMRTRVGDALALVRLNGLENRRPRQLSGGQQQRVALARALVKRPQVLLFDEPLGALDLKLRKEMQFELKAMQRQVEITFIYVTHDQEEALTMSDRIAVMNGGKVLQVGTPTQIYDTPRSRFVADFIGETNFLCGQVKRCEGEIVEVLVDETLPLTVHHNTEIGSDRFITLAIRPEKIMLYPADVEKEHCIRATIEDVIYLGTDTRFVVRLTPESTIVVRRQNLQQEGFTTSVIGQPIKVKLAPENIRILLEDDVSSTPVAV